MRRLAVRRPSAQRLFQCKAHRDRLKGMVALAPKNAPRAISMLKLFGTALRGPASRGPRRT
jgi:hypothetical protein